MEKTKILFLCTGNSCRSQMAEGWAHHLKANEITAWSAGIERHGLNPLAVRAMAEQGVDISSYQSKLISQLPVEHFDSVITLCDNAHQSCPIFPGRTAVFHQGFADPPRLAAGARNEEEAMVHYRQVCEEIRIFVDQLPGILFR